MIYDYRMSLWHILNAENKEPDYVDAANFFSSISKTKKTPTTSNHIAERTRPSTTEQLPQTKKYSGWIQKPMGSLSSQPSFWKVGRWSDKEHLQFLLGLQKYRWSHWVDIAKHYVHTRTAHQLATHAKRFLSRLRKNNPNFSEGDTSGRNLNQQQRDWVSFYVTIELADLQKKFDSAAPLADTENQCFQFR